MSLLGKILRTTITTVIVVTVGWTQAEADDPIVFDLNWDGPETSTVEECYGGDNFCYTFPITGSLGVGLDSENPFLVNIESDILLPPQTPNSPPAITPNLWHNFDLLDGEYLPTDDVDDVLMVFRPAEIGGVLRSYEIFVSITDSGQALTLTGGIEQAATSPLEPNARFSVSGRITGNDSNSADLVDGADFLALQRGYSSNSTSAALDMTGDGVVTAADFSRWQAEYGTVRGSSSTASIQAVPEPSSIALAVLLALAGTTYRSNRS